MGKIEEAIKKLFFGVVFILVIVPSSVLWKIFFRGNTPFAHKRGSSTWKTIKNWKINQSEPF